MSTLYAIYTANSLFGHSASGAMFSFGGFFSLQGEQSNYSVWELVLFVMVGCLGGLIGACFNGCSCQLFYFRSKNLSKATLRLLEVLAIVSLMSSLALFLPVLWQKCSPLPGSIIIFSTDYIDSFL